MIFLFNDIKTDGNCNQNISQNLGLKRPTNLKKKNFPLSSKGVFKTFGIIYIYYLCFQVFRYIILQLGHTYMFKLPQLTTDSSRIQPPCYILSTRVNAQQRLSSLMPIFNNNKKYFC